MDVFAWSAYGALKVDPNFIFHHLNDNPTVISKKQPPRRFSKENTEAVKEEVMKLKRAVAIKEVFLPKLVGQYSGGEEEIREMESVYRFY